MAAGTRVHLDLSLEYSDLKEMEKALKKVISDIKFNREYNRNQSGQAICEWRTLKLPNMDFEIRTINGKRCTVFQSKMNKL